MRDTDIKKEIDELNKLLLEADNISVVRNIKLLVKDYIEEREKRAVSV